MNVTATSRSVGSHAIKMAVENATKFYQTKSGAVHALDSVGLDVREGEFLCILGPSGCGKTTLLWSMAGLHSLSSGDIRLGKQLITKPHPEIAMIFQDANLLPWRNLEKNIELPFEIKRQRPDKERIEKLLDRVGLTGFESKFPRELSGGMQQRASIVRSLAVDPSLLLMDEPFGALDAFTRDEMNLLISGNLDGDGQDHRLRHAFHFGGDLPRRPRGGDVGAARAASPRSMISTFRARDRSRSRPAQTSSNASCRSSRASNMAAAPLPAWRSHEAGKTGVAGDRRG